MMPIDIRDYLPPSLKHVMAYANPAERAKRKDAARDAFGRPTPVPLTDGDGIAGEDSETELDEETIKSRRAAGAVGRVAKEPMPPALPSPREREKVPAVSARKVRGWLVIVGTVGGLLVAVTAIAVPAWWYRQQLEVERAKLSAAMPRETVQGVPVPSVVPVPSEMPSEMAFVIGAAPAVSASASAAPMPAPSAKASAWPTFDDPYAEARYPKPRASVPPVVDAGSAPSSKEPVITE
jgi:hypothetical protein